MSIHALAFALSVQLLAPAAPLAETPWQTLGKLNGTWIILNPRTTSETAFRINYRMISKDSALVETFGNPAKQTTETIYHRDGDKLMATHYCAQGNQPRLVLSAPGVRDKLSFNFLDITNLKNKADSHLIKIDFILIDRTHLERRETYTENGVAEESVLRLEREQ